MLFRTWLLTLLIALPPSLSAGFGVHAVVGGKRFTAPLKSQRFCDTLNTLYITARSRHGVERGLVAEFYLACGPIPEVLPQTVDCVTSHFGHFRVGDPKRVLLDEWGANRGMLQATITSFALHSPYRHPRWRVRGTFNGTLDPLTDVSSPLNITDGEFRASLVGVLCGND